MTKEEFYKTASGNVKDGSYFCTNINCSECPFSGFSDCLEQSVAELFEKIDRTLAGLKLWGK